MRIVGSKGICFVISPIGDPGTDVRRRADQILQHIIEPAASECDYKAMRADAISEPGIITSQVIQHLVNDPMVIADLAGRNPNVFYELAIRHAVKKPIVQMIQVGETIPFDISQTRTIQVDHKDLDSVASCKRELVRQIRTVERNPANVDNPITTSVDLQFLRKSKNLLEKSNAEILTILQEIKSSVRTLAFRSSSPRIPTLKFLQTLDKSVYRELEDFASSFGITVAELIRDRIMPEWIQDQESESPGSNTPKNRNITRQNQHSATGK